MKKRIQWTKELCVASAKNFKTATVWARNSGGAYDYARLNKLLEECCKHMEKRNQNKKHG